MIHFFKSHTPDFLLSWYHFILVFLGAIFSGFPSRKLIVIGVTGTNGKSSVVYMIARLLKDAGFRVAASSSIEFQIGEKRWPNTYKMTMPGRFFLQKFLRRAVNEGCTHAVVEVTSEGIAQHRHQFIEWDVAVFLNISPEHIERHGSYEHYREAKGKLFAALKFKSKKPLLRQGFGGQAKTIIVNLADREAGYFLRFPADRYIGFRFAHQHTHGDLPLQGRELVATAQDSQFMISAYASAFAKTTEDKKASADTQNYEFKTPLLGEFNAANWLAAISVGLSQGLDLRDMTQTVSRVRAIPGRLEEIENNRGIRIFVDYAHTPTALESVYKTLRAIGNTPYATGKLICVLGAAGGGRDKWKRPELGKIASQYCDQIVLTDEDPYDENQNRILSEIESGISKSSFDKLRIPSNVEGQVPNPNYEKILDRKDAIFRAINAATQGDIVVITGKGCEPWMMVAHGKKIPWDDRKVVREALALQRTR